jgi:type I restriction enzyme M protein
VITGELKSKVDRVWDAFWSGGISNPLELIEQITYLLFVRRLDDLETLAERKGRLGGPSDLRFGSDQQELRWSRFKNEEPAVMFATVGDKVFPFLRTLGGDGSTYGEHMKDARFTIPTPQLLSRRHQRRPVRVHAFQDRQCRPKRTIPDATPHHQADGRYNRAEAFR